MFLKLNQRQILGNNKKRNSIFASSKIKTKTTLYQWKSTS